MGSLCADCNTFDLQCFRDDKWGQCGYPFKDVFERAATCSLCSMLAACFTEESEMPRKFAKQWIKLELLNSERSPVEVRSDADALQAMFIGVFIGSRGHVRLWPDEGRLGSAMLRLYACKESAAAASGDIVGVYNLDILHPANEIMQDWLSNCDNHDKCRKTISGQDLDPRSSPLPTRCIFVGTMAEPDLRLRETSGMAGSYITLSHRWTMATEQCATHLGNYSARQRLLYFEELPLNFQQAVLVARKLGVEHVWIDSLCIVQAGDGGADWRSEAVKMGSHYQNALLTLASTLTERLLPLESNLERALVRLPYRNRHDAETRSYIYVQSVPYLDQQYQTDIGDCELFGRGWVWQEYILSRRLIWFTSTNIIFECQSSRPRDIFGQSTTKQTSITTKSNLTLSTSARKEWLNTVTTYTKLHFTQPAKDRSIALSSLALEFGQVLANDVQTSGNMYDPHLWSGYEHVDLLWERVKMTSEPLERLPSYPSWSWLSLYAEVRWSADFPEALISAWNSFKVLESTLCSSGVPQIHLRSRIMRITLDRRLKASEVRTIFSRRCRPRETDDHHYRAVRDGSKHNNLCGWACLDHDSSLDGSQGTGGSATEQDDLASRQVQALHISTTKRIVDDYLVENWRDWFRAYLVLFVRLKHDNVLERIGVGVLFGRHVEKAFRDQEPQDIILE